MFTAIISIIIGYFLTKRYIHYLIKKGKEKAISEPSSGDYHISQFESKRSYILGISVGIMISIIISFMIGMIIPYTPYVIKIEEEKINSLDKNIYLKIIGNYVSEKNKGIVNISHDDYTNIKEIIIYKIKKYSKDY